MRNRCIYLNFRLAILHLRPEQKVENVLTVNHPKGLFPEKLFHKEMHHLKFRQVIYHFPKMIWTSQAIFEDKLCVYTHTHIHTHTANTFYTTNAQYGAGSE